MDFIINFILVTLSLVKWLIIADVVMSLLGISKSNPFYSFTYSVLNPFYTEIRKLPHSIGMFDFTPLIALISIDLVSYFIIKFV